MSQSLEVGWTVNRGLDPEYWLLSDCSPGGHSSRYLVEVPAGSMANHTAMVAQSGSGKSFFLGRLIEEILTKTKARCLVLDPNGDFLQVQGLAASENWDTANYNASKRRGFLPTEASPDHFSADWDKVTKQVRSAETGAGVEADPLRLPWASLSPEPLAIELEPVLRTSFLQIHDFVRAIAAIAEGRVLKTNAPVNVLDEVEKVLGQLKGGESGAARAYLKDEYGIEDLVSARVSRRVADYSEKLAGLPAEEVGEVDDDFLADLYRSLEGVRIASATEAVVRGLKYLEAGSIAQQVYFGLARRFEQGAFFSAMIGENPNALGEIARLEVIDLTSIGGAELRQLAVGSLIEIEFERLRERWYEAVKEPASKDLRTPTFLVVDEAHNLVPAGELTGARAAMRELFRVVAAEGENSGSS